MRPDDSTLDQQQYEAVRKHALASLREASALGAFPTPVAEVMQAAKLVAAPKAALNEGILGKIRSSAARFGGLLKRALSKVLGVIDIPARIIYIDETVHAIKQVFLKLHEVGHSVLPWQRDLYCAIEDCEKTLAPEVSDAFDREANVFASEVLFQLDSFAREAADHDFSIKVPLKLGKKYGASVYSSIRQYVSKHHRNCAVLVLDPPALIEGDGFQCNLRRVITSPEFRFVFGELEWPDVITPDSPLSRFVPLSRKMSRPANLTLQDRNGLEHECIAEGFNSTYQLFVLIHEQRALTTTRVTFGT